MPQILIVGGGYAGFYTAWKLEKLLKAKEAQVTLVDPLPYMTYQPFLPEVAAGSVEPRHAVVAQRRHLKKTRVITAEVTAVDHASKTATITPAVGEPWTMSYDTLVMTAGAVTRTFPIPGVADQAIGLKTIEEASSIRDRLVTNFDRAANLPAGPERDRLLTVVVVGGGFAGIEVLGELRSFASSLLAYYPQLSFEDTHFHLVEAMGRIMPEVSLKTSHWVLKNFAERGIQMHLDTQLQSAVDGVVEMSNGMKVASDLIVWTAGVMASPMVKKNTDLPIEERGRVRVRADLRVEGDDGIVKDAWAAGDVAAVPDLTGGGVGGFCVPNAQHAVRQAKRLAKNLVADLRGEGLRDYVHKSAGAVAGVGLNIGVFQSGPVAVKGYFAWLAHRFYHGSAVPTFERKFRVFGNWVLNFLFRRDIVAIEARSNPRQAFESVAARPRPVVDAAPAAPAATVTTGASAAEAVQPAADPATVKPVAKKPAAKKPAARKTTATSPATKTATAKTTAAKTAAKPAAEKPAETTTPAKAAGKTTAAKKTAAAKAGAAAKPAAEDAQAPAAADSRSTDSQSADTELTAVTDVELEALQASESVESARK